MKRSGSSIKYWNSWITWPLLFYYLNQGFKFKPIPMCVCVCVCNISKYTLRYHYTRYTIYCIICLILPIWYIAIVDSNTVGDWHWCRYQNQYFKSWLKSLIFAITWCWVKLHDFSFFEHSRHIIKQTWWSIMLIDKWALLG